MNTKKLVMQKCEKFLSSPNTFAYRVCKAMKDGDFSDVLSSEGLTSVLNDGAGKRIKATNLTASMQSLLKEDIVKVKVIGKGRNRRKFWFPGWISKSDAESKIGGAAVLPQRLFSDKLVKALGRDFKTELLDLSLNYGRSGTCTAFLLRKILEKLIFLTFAKNGISDQLKDDKGDFVGLKAMLDLATQNKVRGKPLLMPKTKREVEGIKFLGDTSAHNPLTNVEMKTIIPQLPYITTAYEELSRKS